MSLPFEPITMTFGDLHYLVPLPPQQANSPNAVTGPDGAKELELLKVHLLKAVLCFAVMCLAFYHHAASDLCAASTNVSVLAACTPCDERCLVLVLQGISGAFRPETLTALMGVTGAGESSSSICPHASNHLAWGQATVCAALGHQHALLTGAV